MRMPLHPMLLAAATLLATPSTHDAFASEQGGQTLPVSEVTVFKDGTCLLVHEGEVEVDEEGWADVDLAPDPVLGSFWPFLRDPKVELKSTISRLVEVPKTRDASDIYEYLKANEGTHATVVVPDVTTMFFEEKQVTSYTGKLVSVTKGLLTMELSAEETGGATSGRLVVPTPNVLQAFVHGSDVETKVPVDGSEKRELRMRFDGNTPGKGVQVGVAYVQEGVRWIPGYRIDLDEEGTATVKFQATIVNELRDFEDATVRLVVGAPSIMFKGTLDPIAFSHAANAISRGNEYAQTMMLQNVANISPSARDGQDVFYSLDEKTQTGLPQGQDTDELYFYTLENLTLARGERMVVSVGEFTLPYHDTFTLDLGPALPQTLASTQVGHLMAQLDLGEDVGTAVRQLHVKNTLDRPLTRGPAMVFSEGLFMAQGQLKYTPQGGTAEITLNPAIDISVDATEREKDRTSQIMIGAQRYTKYVYVGNITIKNQRSESATIDISREIYGKVDELSGLTQTDLSKSGEEYQLRNWPTWWTEMNPPSKLEDTVTLEPGGSHSVSYEWSFYSQ